VPNKTHPKELDNQIGILGEKAPQWNIKRWIDEKGEICPRPIYVDDYLNTVLVMICFQAWCPKSHTTGFPSIQKLVRLYQEKEEVNFLAIQTVFDCQDLNTIDHLKETQEKYKLSIPFGHDIGNAKTFDESNVLHNYRTGGTPWIIILDKKQKVIYNDFQIEVPTAQKIIKKASRRKWCFLRS